MSIYILFALLIFNLIGQRKRLKTLKRAARKQRAYSENGVGAAISSRDSLEFLCRLWRRWEKLNFSRLLFVQSVLST